jgi:hypothetical protein
MKSFFGSEIHLVFESHLNMMEVGDMIECFIDNDKY